jgi:hypothetical protein
MTMQRWAVTNSTGEVVHGFDADQSFVDDFENKVVDSGVETPSWWSDTVDFHNVTGIDPRPTVGFFLVEGAWVDGTPRLQTDRRTIPANNTTAAKVTFTQQGPQAPASVDFELNGQVVTERLVNGAAAVNITSANPGDVLTVRAGGLSVTITVEG